MAHGKDWERFIWHHCDYMWGKQLCAVLTSALGGGANGQPSTIASLP